MHKIAKFVRENVIFNLVEVENNISIILSDYEVITTK